MTKKRYWLKVLFTVLLVVPVGCFANGNTIEQLYFEPLVNNRNRVVPVKVYFSESKQWMQSNKTITNTGLSKEDKWQWK